MAAIAAGAETPSDGGAAPQEPHVTLHHADPGSEETTGTVTETMDALEYTYMEVDIGDRRIWAVGPRTEVAVGDTAVLPPGILMVDFRSRHLDRNFDEIYMVQSMRVESGGQADSAISPGDEGGQAE
jgi:hypothetical protein